MAYFEKLSVDVENMEVLVVCEVIQAPTMGEISREGFVDGWSSRKYVHSTEMVVSILT